MWSASDHNVVVEWSQAGLTSSIKPGLEWLKEAEQYKEKQYGDRRQEIFFIGTSMDEAEIRAALDQALVTDKEFSLGPRFWSKWMRLIGQGSKEPGERQRSGFKRKCLGK